LRGGGIAVPILNLDMENEWWASTAEKTPPLPLQ